MYLQKSNTLKNLEIVFCWRLEGQGRNSRIRIHWSEAQNFTDPQQWLEPMSTHFCGSGTWVFLANSKGQKCSLLVHYVTVSKIFVNMTFANSIPGQKKWKPYTVFRIRIGSGFNQVSGSVSGSRREKMTHKNIKILGNFIFWSAGCSLLRAKGFFRSFNVLYGGLGIW